MASTEPFARLIKVTGDALGEVLDSYKQYYPPVPFSNYHQVIKNVRALFELVQQLETECLCGAVRATSPRAKKNITEVLNDCGKLAKLLQSQIECRNLRDDASTNRDIQTYCAEVDFFLRTYDRSTEEPTSRTSRAEQTELESLRHRYEEAQLEIARLRSVVDEKAHRLRDDYREGSPSECSCEARLLHIKRLHEEIACLGLLHPRQHGLHSWEDLSGELPHMLDHIRGINEQLKRLTDPGSPVSTTSRASTVHRRNQSEPQNVRQSSLPKDVRPRLPSPTGSNISASRGSISTARNESRKRSSRGTGYFSNQGGWD